MIGGNSTSTMGVRGTRLARKLWVDSFAAGQAVLVGLGHRSTASACEAVHPCSADVAERRLKVVLLAPETRQGEEEVRTARWVKQGRRLSSI